MRKFWSTHNDFEKYIGNHIVIESQMEYIAFGVSVNWIQKFATIELPFFRIQIIV